MPERLARYSHGRELKSLNIIILTIRGTVSVSVRRSMEVYFQQLLVHVDTGNEQNFCMV